MIEHDPNASQNLQPEAPRDPRQEAIDTFFPAWDLLTDPQKGELVSQFQLDGAFAGSPIMQIATEVTAGFVAHSSDLKATIQGVSLALSMIARAWHQLTEGHDLPEDARRVLATYGEGLAASVARSFEGNAGGVLAAKLFVMSTMMGSFGDSLQKATETAAPEIITPGIVLP